MTDEPKTKQSGKFRIPVNAVDRTAERSGKPVAIIGGIQPKPPAVPQQDEPQPTPPPHDREDR
jgi:hypothetical protein